MTKQIVLPEEDYRFIRGLRRPPGEPQVLQKIDWKKVLQEHDSALLLTCGDCDQAWQWVWWLHAQLGDVKPGFRIHLAAWNGGSVTLPEQSLIGSGGAAWKLFSDQLMGTYALKGISLVLSTCHMPCGAVRNGEISVAKQLAYSYEAANRIEREYVERIPGLAVASLAHVNYAGYDEGRVLTYRHSPSNTLAWFRKRGVDLTKHPWPSDEVFTRLVIAS